MGPREDAQRRQDDEALREEDVTVADRLDDRVSEGEGLEPEGRQGYVPPQRGEG